MVATGEEGRNIRMENLRTINMLDDNIARAIRISQKLESGTPIEELSQEDQNLINALNGLKDPTRYEADEAAIVRKSVDDKLKELELGGPEQTDIMETREHHDNQEASPYDQFRENAAALFGEKAIKVVNELNDSHFRMTVHITINYNKTTDSELRGRELSGRANERDVTIDVEKIRNALPMLGSIGSETWQATIIDLPGRLGTFFEKEGSSPSGALNQLHARIQECIDTAINPEFYKDL